MEPNDMLRADPLDILFEHRNKLYGAYPLRKFYAQRMYISMGVMVCLVLVGSFLYLTHKTLHPVITVDPLPDTRLVNFEIKPPPKIDLPQARQSIVKPPASVIWNTPLIVPDHKVIQTVAKVEDLKTAVIALTTTDGPADNGDRSSPGNSATGASSPVVDSAEASNKIFDIAEQMPEFPGGLEALKRFLQKNLQMPGNSLDPGARIRVIARFVVGADGKVRDIEILQPAEEIFNSEVKRVILKMPGWKPGMQNHRAVSVYFQLPVNFVNEE